ncbi:MAG: DUF1674 domain-containing protein [Gammaproteobacteria bacterium]
MPEKLGNPSSEKDKLLPEEVTESPPPAKEIGGRDGPEPTRFGDWEKAGRCIDF